MENPKKNFAERLLEFTNTLQRTAPRKARDGIIYGDMHNRIFATMIDIVILLPVLLFLPMLLLGNTGTFEKAVIINAYQYFVLGFYNIILTYKCGATLGKMIVGLRVVDVITRENINFSQAVIRYISYVTFPLGMMFGSLRKNKRTWHDMLADTVVIYSPNRWYKRHTQAVGNRVRKFLNLPPKS